MSSSERSPPILDPIEEEKEGEEENDNKKKSELNICKVIVPKLSTSTPISKFDTKRVDPESLRKALGQLKKSGKPKEGKKLEFGEELSKDSGEETNKVFELKYREIKKFDTTICQNLSGETSEENKPVTEDTTLIGDECFHTPKQNTPTHSSEGSKANSINESFNTDEMALTSAQYADILPTCKSVKDVEQFVSIIDELHAGVEAGTLPVFMAIVRAKITGKAFDAIKGKSLTTWALLRDALTKGLEEKVDMSTASNKLTHIKQKEKEELKEYIERIKEALAVLDRTAIRGYTNETIRAQILALNDASAKNTFEAGLLNEQLKTVVVAAQKISFNESYNFATNQQHTNFPDKKGETEGKEKTSGKKNVICYSCGKPNHISSECFSRRNQIRSRSLPNRYNSFGQNSGPLQQNRFNTLGQLNRNFASSNRLSLDQNTNNAPFSANRYYNQMANNSGSRPNQAGNYNRESVPFNQYERNANRSNFSRPNASSNTNQSNYNRNQTYNSANNSRNNAQINSNRNAVRLIREEELDWDQITPLNAEGQGNE